MRNLLIKAMALMAAAVLAGCVANESGTVVDRKPCKTSTCIYVQRDSDGSIDWSLVGPADYPKCAKGARWPDCKY